MIIRLREVHKFRDRAWNGIRLASEALGVATLPLLATGQVSVDVHGSDEEVFLEMARECAEKGQA